VLEYLGWRFEEHRLVHFQHLVGVEG
jgi:hypothetical protein